jgi:GNAT superfamily N-acetyltransferase
LRLHITAIESQEDFEAALLLRNECLPDDPLSLEEQLVLDGLASKRKKYRCLVRDNGVPIARATAREEESSGATTAMLDVLLPDRCFTKERYLEILCHLEEQATEWGATKFFVVVSNEPEDELIATRAHGYEVVQMNPLSFLDLVRFQPEPHLPTVARLEDEDVRFLSFRQLSEERPGWIRDLWELESELLQDVPFPEPPETTPYKEYEQFVLSPMFQLDSRFVAVQADELLGMSEIRLNKVNPKLAMTHLTGVKRNHRRRGLAKALKVKALLNAKAEGVERVGTDNEEANPMYQLNQQLGFQPEYAWVILKKDA